MQWKQSLTMRNFTISKVRFLYSRGENIKTFSVDWMMQTSKRWQYIKKMMEAYENYIS